MTVIPEKKEYKACTPELTARFCEELEARKLCNRISVTRADEKSHFDRYGYAYNNKKVSVVYDVKARMLSVTAPDEIAPRLDALFTELAKKAADNVKPVKAEKSKPEPRLEPKRTEQKKTEQKSAEQCKRKQKSAEQQKADGLKQESSKTESKKAELKKAEADEGTGDFSLKKFTAGRFDDVINKLKKDKKSFKIEQEGVTDKGKPTELVSYAVKSRDNKKLKLRFMPQKQIVQLQGKHGQAFSELQILISEETDYKAAVDAHIEQSNEDKKATELERQLKKLIPNAFKYLSDQSKIDFTIGVIEVLNGTTKHYDYSMLLLSPFRGLERLIFDVQRAQNIVVKMIGQAYEKENGKHVLKASYRRKINSIVYAEVASALYALYFETRNYYAHTDSDGNEGRRITDRAEVKTVFMHILEVIDYNCKKLSEIGFTI